MSADPRTPSPFIPPGLSSGRRGPGRKPAAGAAGAHHPPRLLDSVFQPGPSGTRLGSRILRGCRTTAAENTAAAVYATIELAR